MSKDLGSQYVQAVSQGDFTRIHDLFSDDIVFLAATQGDSWHAIGWSDTEKALRELYPPNEQVSEVVTVDYHDVPGRYRICVDISSNMDLLNTNIKCTTTPRVTRSTAFVCCVQEFMNPNT